MTRIPTVGLAALVALLGLGPACATLKPLDAETCGNAVIEPGEDCDSHSAFAGAKCGAAGSAGQCRYVCSTSTACPTSWGCGQDGLCRQASGQFEKLRAFEVAAKVLKAGDFTGVGRPLLLALSDDDALGRRFGRLLDPQAAVQPRNLQLPAPLASPVWADLDADAHDDLAFADLRGVALMHGNDAAAIDFISYPSKRFDVAGTRVRAIPMDVIPKDPGDEVVIWRDSPGAGGQSVTQLVRPAAAGLPEAVLAVLPLGESRLEGRIVRARFDERSSTPCAQIVVPYTHGVYIFTPCKQQGSDVVWNEAGTPEEIKLPGAMGVQAGVKVGDVDGDGHLDLLIGGGDSTFAALGNGDATFHPPGASAPLGTAGNWLLPDVTSSQALPLAIGDLNGDGAIDYVMPTGIVVSTGTSYRLGAQNLAENLNDAVIADFNGNGKPDVIGASPGAVNLEFFNNAGGGTFNHASVATHGPPQQLTVGDFDGDLINDLAFAEPSGNEFAWSIGYGATAGPPTDLRRMGRLAGVSDMAVASLPDLTGIDGISDLVIVSNDSANLTDSLVYSLGRGERVMLAPFALRQGDENDLPQHLAAGRFADDAAGAPRLDLGLVAVDGKGRLRLWYANPTRAVSSRNRIRSEALAPDFHPDEGAPGMTFSFGAHVAAGDLDGDGYDELVMIAPFGSDATRSALVVGGVEHKTADRWVLQEPRPVALHSTVYTPIVVADVDGDGKQDVLIKEGNDHPSALTLLWSDGKGNLDTAQPTSLDPDGSGLYGFTCVPKAKGCQLYAVSGDALYLITFSGHTPTFKVIEKMPGGVGITFGDFDGDGLADLAVTDDTAVHFLRSKPVLP